MIQDAGFGWKLAIVVVSSTDFAPFQQGAFCGRAGTLDCDLALEMAARTLLMRRRLGQL
jgi:hypothetical protein